MIKTCLNTCICPLIIVLAQERGSDLGLQTVPLVRGRGGARELCPKLRARVPGARPRAKGRGPTLELTGQGRGAEAGS